MSAVEPGRCGEHWDDCPRLAAGDRFDFACAGCGDCCRQRRDLVLSGYDLYRIARRLSLPPRIVAAAFCKSYLAPESCLPALRLTPDPKTGNCRFFEGSACTIHAARPLADALKCGVNDLPLSLVLSWYEQKAVAILLTLLALGVKNIHLGPSLPAFVSPDILNLLVENWGIKPISTPDEDLKALLG